MHVSSSPAGNREHRNESNEQMEQMSHDAERPIVSDRRYKQTLNEVASVVTVLMCEKPKMAVVRSTILFGSGA